MMYKIYTNKKDFLAKCDEIMTSGMCGNASQYADIDSCKHPTLDHWALPVLHYAIGFFNQEELIPTLNSDWNIVINKNI